jgi:hypothetical protein
MLSLEATNLVGHATRNYFGDPYLLLRDPDPRNARFRWGCASACEYL